MSGTAAWRPSFGKGVGSLSATVLGAGLLSLAYQLGVSFWRGHVFVALQLPVVLQVPPMVGVLNTPTPNSEDHHEGKATYVNEPGFYNLVLSSLPGAPVGRVAAHFGQKVYKSRAFCSKVRWAAFKQNQALQMLNKVATKWF